MMASSRSGGESSSERLEFQHARAAASLQYMQARTWRAGAWRAGTGGEQTARHSQATAARSCSSSMALKAAHSSLFIL